MSSENNVLRSNGAERIGIALPDEWQLEPEQSTGAVVVPNLHAKYIAVYELTPDTKTPARNHRRFTQRRR